VRRKVESGWENRWTFAVPVRRAWRINRRIEVRHIAPHTYTHDRARVIASRGELLTEEEALNSLRLPVAPMNVFGEAPVAAAEEPEFQLQSMFAPSRGISPAFGPRTSEYEDGEHYLYMLQLDGDIAALLGRAASAIESKILVKIGFSNAPTRRRDDHNAALTGWPTSLES
jgi:hypothetical protein